MNGLCSLLIRAVLTLVVLAACVAPAVAQEVVEYIHTDALGHLWRSPMPAETSSSVRCMSRMGRW